MIDWNINVGKKVYLDVKIGGFNKDMEGRVTYVYESYNDKEYEVDNLYEVSFSPFGSITLSRNQFSIFKPMPHPL